MLLEMAPEGRLRVMQYALVCLYYRGRFFPRTTTTEQLRSEVVFLLLEQEADAALSGLALTPTPPVAIPPAEPARSSYLSRQRRNYVYASPPAA